MSRRNVVSSVASSS